MFLLTLFIALIFSGSASGVEVKKKAVGDEVTFNPATSLPSPVSSIAWKHRNNNVVVKVIEWDEDGINIPNDRFKGITTLDEKTGVMTIKGVDFIHSGEYFFEVDSKEQGEKFTLTVEDRVQKPNIKIESTNDPDVVYLRCEYSGKIIWRNSAGETLPGSKISPKGESITVKKNGDPKNFYTCSLRNDVSEETSDPIYEKDLFKDAPDGLSAGAIVVIVLIVLGLIGGGIGGAFLMYKRNESFRNLIQCLPCFKDYQPAPTTDKGQGGNDPNTTGQGGNDPKPTDETLKEVSTVTNTNDNSSPAPDDKNLEGKNDNSTPAADGKSGK